MPRPTAGRPPDSNTEPWAVIFTAARGWLRGGSSAANSARPSALRVCLDSVSKFGWRPRVASPKRNFSHPRGAKGSSSNITAPSTGRFFAGPPNRCSAATVNFTFVAQRPGGVSTFTRI